MYNSSSIMGPTRAFSFVSIAALVIGAGSYFIGLFNAYMPLNEKGYYLTIMLLGLFGVVSLQKTLRDNVEGLPVTKAYLIACMFASGAAIALLVVGLYNAELALSEKGFFGIAYVLSLFAAIAVQKNIRDTHKAGNTDTAVDHSE